MQIVNVKAYGGVRAAREAGVVYCGRGSPLGNPFRIGKDGTREEVIAKFRTWLWRQLTSNNRDVQEALEALREDSTLACHCAPRDCHCSIIERAWVWWAREGRGLYGVQPGADVSGG